MVNIENQNTTSKKKCKNAVKGIKHNILHDFFCDSSTIIIFSIWIFINTVKLWYGSL